MPAGVEATPMTTVVTEQRAMNLTEEQCMLVRDNFVKMFMDKHSGDIMDCHNDVVQKVWDHTLLRVYNISTFEDVRNKEVVSDEQLTQILMRTALGSYIDTTDTSRSFARIRADAYTGEVKRMPGNSDVKVGILEVALVASLLAVWQGWWVT
jgi:hypothetical protein